MFGAAVEVLGELAGVDPAIRSRVELDTLSGDAQVRLRPGSPIPDSMPQACEGLAQVVSRRLLGCVWPKQARQAIPAVTAIAFHCEVDKQRTGFGRFKARDRLPIKCNFQRTEHG